MIFQVLAEHSHLSTSVRGGVEEEEEQTHFSTTKQQQSNGMEGIDSNLVRVY